MSAPCPPGCCTEWVASKITGAPVLRKDRQRAHVGDERVVAEGRAALGDEHVRVAGAGDLGDDVRHVPGREELALLDVDGRAGLRRGDQQIGLAAQEGRDLQHVDRLRDARALLGLVHVGQHRQAELVADLGEDRQRLRRGRCRARRRAGAVRLVERGLVDEPDADAARRSPSAPTPSRAHARGSRARTARRSAPAAARCRSAPADGDDRIGNHHVRLLGKPDRPWRQSRGRSIRKRLEYQCCAERIVRRDDGEAVAFRRRRCRRRATLAQRRRIGDEEPQRADRGALPLRRERDAVAVAERGGIENLDRAARRVTETPDDDDWISRSPTKADRKT